MRTINGKRLIGRYVQHPGWDPMWATTDGILIHGVVGWEPVDWHPTTDGVPPAPQSRPAETQAMRGGV